MNLWRPLSLLVQAVTGAKEALQGTKQRWRSVSGPFGGAVASALRLGWDFVCADSRLYLRTPQGDVLDLNGGLPLHRAKRLEGGTGAVAMRGGRPVQQRR